MRSVDPKSSAPIGTIGMVRATMVASAVAAAAAALPGCVSDPDCGICDPENLILETIAASNYAGKQIYVLSPECEGQKCPEALTKAKFYVTEVGQCKETEDAKDSPRGADEWCKISPLLVGADGINFVFNNLLDPQSIELVRKQLTNPQLFEVFDWKTHIIKINGPTTRFNGDYFKGSQSNPDIVSRAVNLSCIQNLAAGGQPFNHEVLANNPQICDNFWNPGSGLIPLRTEVDVDLKATSGRSDWRSSANSCDAPDDGPDTCCTSCDLSLAVHVGRYGADGGGAKKTSAGDLTCDPANDDKFVACRNFVPWIDRSDEDPRAYHFFWGNEEIDSSIPFADRLRETHPDFRPPGAEQKTVHCTKDTDCTTAANLPGTECVGRLENSSLACSQDSADEACVEKRCIAQWFGSCESTEAGGACVDKRFNDSGVAGCFTVTEGFTAVNSTLNEQRQVSANQRLAAADLDENGTISIEEGCGPYGECDPYSRPGIQPNFLYDRKKTLPEQTRDCICPCSAEQSAQGCKVNNPDYCAETIEKLCVPGREGQYATKFVTRNGGVIYDPSVKGVAYRIADLGGVTRARVEFCAQGASLIGGLNIKDGWRANDTGSESNDNFDRAMCSSSKYEIQFAVPEDSKSGDPVQYIKDKVGNTLSGRRTYTFETPDFHVVPGSGFPTDNLRIGACDDFEIGFSNKYDMSVANLRKLQIVHLLPLSEDTYQEGEVVAGGVNCTEDPEAVTGNSPPCLTVNVRSQSIGKLSVLVNSKDFGQVLKTGERYRVRVPGLGYKSYDEFAKVLAGGDPNVLAEYQAAFWDACGMPLILGGTKSPDFYYDFTIDPPKAKEDEDGVLGLSLIDDDAVNSCDRLGDSVQLSCDNAKQHYNPDQLDTDLDGFGDIIDLCPTIETAINTADSDKDGIGNECDTCVKQLSAYNKEAMAAGVPPELLVRNTPIQSDWDQDGVGDACDNCVKLANCGEFNSDNPWEIGKVAPTSNSNVCQTDIDALKMIGDACVDGGVAITFDGAAGPVGFGNDDDFDGDGLRNLVDFCPRMPIEKVTCANDSECPGTKCTEGVCNHDDSDGDNVGNVCDTCPYDSNPEQVADGGMQEDDEDGDFVGRRCETNPDCYKVNDPRPFSFYDVSVNGYCCTVVFDEISKERMPREPYDLARDDNGDYMIVGGGRILAPDCNGIENCRPLPDVLKSRPGVTSLPGGCEEALVAAGYDPANKVYAKKLTLADVGSEVALWSNMCLLPQFDQDFDGIGDACDLCPFAHDPNNEPYINENQRLFPGSGKYCNGAYAINEVQKALTRAQPLCYEAEGDTDTDTDTGTGGGTDTSGG